MGWINVLKGWCKLFLRWKIFFCMMEIYVECFVDFDGKVKLMFDIIYLIGWVFYEF